ncbi:MAG: NusG domain II-containing protein [Clostridia bacterium]|nr:NusG domain II-containing protein [Clostridia bacterium]
MSLKKVKQVKQDKGFRLFDLIIYGAAVVLVAVLFIVIFTTQNKDPISGVRIYVSAEVVFEYEFGGQPSYKDGLEVKEDAEGLTVTVRGDKGYNVVYIDKQAKTVKVTDADCRGKQCVYFAAIDDNSKLIYCSPHALRIEPLINDFNNPDIIM